MFRELAEGRSGFWAKLWAAAAPPADSPFHMNMCTSNETAETGRRKHAVGRRKHAAGRKTHAAGRKKQAAGRRKHATGRRKQPGRRKHAAVRLTRAARTRAGGSVTTKRSHFRDEGTEAGLRSTQIQACPSPRWPLL